MKEKEKQMPKIKIPPQDLKHFLKESLVIDPFWYDLYGIEDNKKDNNSKN